MWNDLELGYLYYDFVVMFVDKFNVSNFYVKKKFKVFFFEVVLWIVKMWVLEGGFEVFNGKVILFGDLVVVFGVYFYFDIVFGSYVIEMNLFLWKVNGEFFGCIFICCFLCLNCVYLEVLVYLNLRRKRMEFF